MVPKLSVASLRALSLLVTLTPALAQLRLVGSDLRGVPSPPPAGQVSDVVPMGIVNCDQGDLLEFVESIGSQTSQLDVRRFSRDGTFRWERGIGEPGLRYCASITDGAGGAFLAAMMVPSGATGATELRLIRLDGNGTPLHVEAWSPGMYSLLFDRAHLVRTADGKIWIGGTNWAQGRIFLKRATSTGTIEASVEVSTAPTQRVLALAPRPDGGILLVGDSSSQPSVWSFDGSLALSWQRTFPSPWSSSPSTYECVAVEPHSDVIVVAGDLLPGATSGRGLLSAYALDGTALWHEEFVSPIGNGAHTTSMVLSSDRRAWLAVSCGYLGTQARTMLASRSLDGTPQTDETFTPPDGVQWDRVTLAALGTGRLLALWSVVPSTPVFQAAGRLTEHDAAGRICDELPISGAIGGRARSGPWISEDRAHVLGTYGLPYLFAGAWTLAIDLHTLVTEVCSGATSAAGCEPTLTTTGTACASTPGELVLHANAVDNRTTALLLYGLQGGLSAPLPRGARCIAAPFLRTPLLATGGTHLPTHDCSGRLSVRFDRLALRDPALTVAGTTVHAQFWCREGAGQPTQGYFSGAVRFEVTP